ncbi:MAG: ATP-binding protein, partial [Acidimicrobiales bacterium]
LDMTRIEAGVLTLNRERTTVRHIIDDAVSTMETSLEDHKVEVLVPTSMPDVDVDPVLMGQVLINLLDNAVRHAPANSVITVKGERRGHEVVMIVADTGPGVPVSDRATIFDRFVSLGTGGRAGLGLTIAKTFVEAHGERVWYEEVTGGGARFVVSLPVAPGAER